MRPPGSGSGGGGGFGRPRPPGGPFGRFEIPPAERTPVGPAVPPGPPSGFAPPVPAPPVPASLAPLPPSPLPSEDDIRRAVFFGGFSPGAVQPVSYEAFEELSVGLGNVTRLFDGGISIPGNRAFVITDVVSTAYSDSGGADLLSLGTDDPWMFVTALRWEYDIPARWFGIFQIRSTLNVAARQSGLSAVWRSLGDLLGWKGATFAGVVESGTLQARVVNHTAFVAGATVPDIVGSKVSGFLVERGLVEAIR